MPAENDADRRAGLAAVAVLLRLRAAARARWRAWLGLAVLAGVLGGAAISGFAGANRTETAYPRFLEATDAFDVLVTNGGTTATNVNSQFDFDEVAALPEVAEATRVRYYFPSGEVGGRQIGPGDIAPLASDDGVFGGRLNQARPLRGRLARGQREVAVSILAAEIFQVDVGDTMKLRLSGPAALASGLQDDPGGATAFEVVGVVAMNSGFPPLTGGLPPPVLLSSAYSRAHPEGVEAFAVRLRGGRSDAAAFQAELDRLAGGEQVVAIYESDLTTLVQRSVKVDATALRVVSALGAAVTLLLVGQALARQSTLEAEHHPTLHALGMTRWDLAAVGVARTAVVALGGGVVAVATAVALSPLSPVGVARDAEVDPGLNVDARLIFGGAAAVLLLTLTIGTLAVVWSTRQAVSSPGSGGRPRRPSRIVSKLATGGLPAPAVSGLRMALEPGRGRAAGPLRSTILSATVGIAMIVAVLTFTSSLDHLLHRPQLYGWNWDAQVGDAFSVDLRSSADRLTGNADVTAVAAGTIARLQIGNLGIDTLSIERLRGDIQPVVVDGRPAQGPSEILLGMRTLRDLGLHVGDSVTVGLGQREESMLIVGGGVLTEFSGGARFGEGAALTMEGMRRIVPDAEEDVLLLRLRPGADLDSVLLGDPAAAENRYLPTTPSDLSNLERVGGTPSILAGLLGIMAVATLAHTLVSSVRRGRRDLAIFKTLGYVRRQIHGVVAWQSSVLAGLALAAGLPLGMAMGRSFWGFFADGLGVRPEAVTPVAAMVLLVPLTLIIANVVAALPARFAARTQPAAALRRA